MGQFFSIIPVLFLFFLMPLANLWAADFALDFDGVNDYVDLGASSSLNLGTDFEISVWVKTTTEAGGNIINRIDAGGEYSQFWLLQIAVGGNVGKVEGAMGAGLKSSSVYSSIKINDGAWHKVVWKRNADNQTITIDDVDRTSVNFIDSGIGNINPPQKIYVGADIEGSAYYLDGTVDGLKITIDGTVKGLWYFDDGSGTTLTDSSANGINGTVSGATWVAGNVPAPAVEPPPPPPRISVSGGPTAYRPEVEIIAPKLGGSFHYIVDIDYKATDKNDKSASEDERKKFGLSDKPVSIYYSETSDTRRRTLIASNLPAGPRYQWDATIIPDGNTYRIIVEAQDNFGEISEAISNSITIDHTPPVFRVKNDPPFSRGEDIQITVDVNEELVGPPEVTIRQRGFRPVPLEITGGRQYLPTIGDVVRYEGVYRVIKGYDGPARVSIRAKDRAGLVGTTIVSGDTFSVGIDTPPAPIIIEPLNNDIIKDELITVKGKSREDVSLVLTVNGKDKYEARPDDHDEFIFRDIRFYPDFNRGSNFLNIVAIDSLGNISEPAEVAVSFNKNPEISILKPKTGEIIRGDVKIAIDALDRNEDPLEFTYEISQDSGRTWETLVAGVSQKEIKWKTHDYPDGLYTLRVIASDGTTEIEAHSGEFSVLNYLPIIKFDEERRLIISKNELVVSGEVITEERLRRTSIVQSLEYSLDSGSTWISVLAKDGEYDSTQEKFSLELKRLGDGVNNILFRAKDSRGFYGRTSKQVIVDFGPPDAPRIDEPIANSIIANEDDEDLKKAGVQITVKGRGEALAEIRITTPESIFESKIDNQGLFEISGVTLRNHGENNLTATVIDPAGNQSNRTNFSYAFNNPPDLKFISPRKERGLNHAATIEWRISDPDGDTIGPATLSYRRNHQEQFMSLVKDTREELFRWDVSKLVQGDGYQLKLEATDGVSFAEKIIDITIDHTAPKIFLTPLEVNYFKKEFNLTLTGSARDNFSGIEIVEYSLDNEHWFKGIITSGFGERSASFRLKHPFVLEDGKYEVRVRAIDFSGNISESTSQSIVVDTSPPRIGSFLLKSAFVKASADKSDFHSLISANSQFAVPEGEVLMFAISLESDTAKAVLFVGSQEINLAIDSSTGLWQSIISIGTPGVPIGTPGVQMMTVSASDAFGNEVTKHQLGEIVSKPAPKVSNKKTSEGLAGAEINIEIFDSESSRWLMWQAKSYGGRNPVLSGATGEYRLLLPTGKYRLTLKKDGYTRLTTEDFELRSAAFITESFLLEKRSGLRGFVENMIEKITIQ